jgi:hypothetical protein
MTQGAQNDIFKLKEKTSLIFTIIERFINAKSSPDSYTLYTGAAFVGRWLCEYNDTYMLAYNITLDDTHISPRYNEDLTMNDIFLFLWARDETYLQVLWGTSFTEFDQKFLDEISSIYDTESREAARQFLESCVGG